MEKFFALSVYDWWEGPEIGVLESRHQPTCFLDKNGHVWVAVEVDGKLMRQERP